MSRDGWHKRAELDAKREYLTGHGSIDGLYGGMVFVRSPSLLEVVCPGCHDIYGIQLPAGTVFPGPFNVSTKSLYLTTDPNILWFRCGACGEYFEPDSVVFGTSYHR